MVGKKDIKFIKSLNTKKNRLIENCFVVEGKKSVFEFLYSDYKLRRLYTVDRVLIDSEKQIFVDQNTLKKISFLKSPDDYIALFELKNPKPIEENKLIVALDSVGDPGNLGTIIRTCDWFGIKDIICSLNSVDCYNPKVVQSSMGSISRVNVSYLDLEKYFKTTNVYLVGASIRGKSVFKMKQKLKTGVIVFGNESKGLSKKLENILNLEISIPKPNKSTYPESLNLASSVGIILSHLTNNISFNGK